MHVDVQVLNHSSFTPFSPPGVVTIPHLLISYFAHERPLDQSRLSAPSILTQGEEPTRMSDLYLSVNAQLTTQLCSALAA